MRREELLEKWGEPVQVLDKGYVLLVDAMGDEDAISQSARVSYAEGTTSLRDDEGLIRYLIKNRHTTPLESCRLKLEIKLPIFVERQWARHRTASWNEMSARYSVLPNDFYFPDPSVVQAQSKSNKQGRDEDLPDHVVGAYLLDLRDACSKSYAQYESALATGVTRELARCLLPINVYTKKVWTQDLHNLMHFLSLRMDPHAQWEIRQYANVIAEVVKDWVPAAWKAFEDYRLEAKTFSRMEMNAIRELMRAVHGDRPTNLERWKSFMKSVAPEMSQRERKEFREALGMEF